MDTQRIQELEESLNPDTRNRVVTLRPLLPELVIIPPEKARQKLETTNDARQRLWGNQVSRIPILQGSADEVFYALLKCVVADHAEQRVISITVERVSAPATDNEREQLERAREHMRPGLREDTKDYYEKQLMKHMQKSKGKDKEPRQVQEINLKVSFANQTFGPHRIIRVGRDVYYFMACSNKDEQGQSGESYITEKAILKSKASEIESITEPIPEPSCPTCGNIHRPTDLFCRICGSPIKATIHCHKCGNIVQSKDLFCTKCGSSLNN